MEKSIMALQVIALVLTTITRTCVSVPTTAVSAPPIPHRVQESNSTVILSKFTNEFIDLEKSFNPKKSNQLLKNYTCLRDKINSYGQHESLNNSEDRVTLAHLNTALMSKICGINFRPVDVSHNLQLDLDAGLDSAISTIERYQEQRYVKASQESFNKYEANFKQKVQETLSFMERGLAGDLGRTYANVDAQVNALINEVIGIHNDTVMLRTKQADLLKQLIFRKLLSVVNFGSEVVTFLSHLGAAAGTGVGWSKTIPEVVSGSITNRELDKLPAGIKDFVKTVRYDVDRSVDLFEDKLKFAKLELEKIHNSTDAAKEMTKKLEDAQTEMKKITGPKTLKKLLRSYEFLVEKREQLGDFMERKVELARKDDSLSQTDKPMVIGYMNKALSIVNLAEIRLSTLQIFKNDSEKMNKFVAVERRIKNYAKSLEKFKARIAEALVRNLDEMETSFKSKKNGLTSLSQWDVSETTQVIKSSIEDMTKGYSSGETFLNECVRRLDRGMKLTLDLYHRIGKYHDEVTLSGYVKDIGQEVSTEDPKINFLKSVILSSVIRKHYVSTLSMFKNYVFPLETFYLSDQDNHLWYNDSAVMVKEVTNRIFRLKEKVKSDASVITNYDQHLHNDVQFHESDSIRHPPFYRWGLNSVKRVLSDFLSGKEVVLDADVYRALPAADAIQFSMVDIRFRLENATMQQKFNDALGKFQVLATHFGNSEYKCCYGSCEISMPPVNLEFSVTKENDSPQNSNDVYRLLRNSKPMLSPYASWSFRLEVDSTNAGFYVFNEFKHEPMTLELIGRGGYLKRCVGEICRSVS